MWCCLIEWYNACIDTKIFLSIKGINDTLLIIIINYK